MQIANATQNKHGHILEIRCSQGPASILAMVLNCIQIDLHIVSRKVTLLGTYSLLLHLDFRVRRGET